jgi:hypothetical protein
MPYVQVAPENLVVGQEYVLTRKGLKPRVNDGLEHEVRNVPAYKTYGYGPPAPLVKATVVKKPETVVIPPTSKKALEDAYRALLAYKKKDAPYSERAYEISYGKKPKYNTFAESDYRKRAFFAGARDSRPDAPLVFTQERSFGSKKPVAFQAVNIKETHATYRTFLHEGLSADNWAFWQEQGNNGTRRNNNVANNGTRRNRNVPTGNLLGLNNAPQAPRNNRTANQALNNLTKKHMLEQNLKGLF